MTESAHSKFDPQKHHRKSIRLQGYDYSQAGAYFVTIVTYQRQCLFGKITNGELGWNDFGKIADECWRAIPEHFTFVELGAYVVMPNHVHGIIVIHDDESRTDVGMMGDGRGAISVVGATHASPLQNPPRGPTPRSLGAIVGSFKSAVTRIIGREYNATGIWQRNYYEHIIRNDHEMGNIWRYIESNPAGWEADDENPNFRRG